MIVFLDGVNLDEIAELWEAGLIDGVTTNPSLIAKSGREMNKTIYDICKILEWKGHVSAEVLAIDYSNMLLESEKLTQIAENVVIKLPATAHGLRACKTLYDKGVKVNMTLCFSPMQALLAARAGAYYISAFVGRVEDAGYSGEEMLRNIASIYDNYDYSTKILSTSVRSMNHIQLSALLGADAITVPYNLITSMIKHPLTDKGLEMFLSDWKKFEGQAAHL